MLGKIVISSILLISASQLFSQTDHEDKLSLTFSYGITGRFIPESTVYGNPTGSTWSIEVSNLPTNNAGFFINYLNTKYSLTDHYPEFIEQDNVVDNNSLTGGVRFFTDNKKLFCRFRCRIL